MESFENVIVEFDNLCGSIKKSRVVNVCGINDFDVTEERDPYLKFKESSILYYPAKEFTYRRKCIIYQIFQQNNIESPSVRVPGERISGNYINKRGNLCVRVSLINERDRRRILYLIKNRINQDWPIDFW